jgi:arabinogalactan oligomer/maltooligosaccharide transport system substrate-binding protein
VLLGQAGEAFARLRALGARGSNLLHNDLDREQAIRLFLNGRTPFLICSSRALMDIDLSNRSPQRRANPLRITVCPVPPFADGGPARSFVSVYGFFVPRGTPNLALARDIVGDYLTQDVVAKALSVAQQRPPAHLGTIDTLAADSPVRGYAEECRRGLIMPSFPFMKEVWASIGEAERRVISGADPYRTAASLGRTVERIISATSGGRVAR